jgi:hypothetical protein
MFTFIYNWLNTCYKEKIIPIDEKTISICMDETFMNDLDNKHRFYSEKWLNRETSRIIKKNHHKENQMKLYTIQHKIRNFIKLDDDDFMDIYYFANEEKFFMIQLLLYCINCLMEYNELVK